MELDIHLLQKYLPSRIHAGSCFRLAASNVTGFTGGAIGVGTFTLL